MWVAIAIQCTQSTLPALRCVQVIKSTRSPFHRLRETGASRQTHQTVGSALGAGYSSAIPSFLADSTLHQHRRPRCPVSEADGNGSPPETEHEHCRKNASFLGFRVSN